MNALLLLIHVSHLRHNNISMFLVVGVFNYFQSKAPSS
jgi:hypothetical protein